MSPEQRQRLNSAHLTIRLAMLGSAMAMRTDPFAERFPAYMDPRAARDLLAFSRMRNDALRAARAVRRVGEW